jgi:glycerophosphoryl diester phosphodiesterase
MSTSMPATPWPYPRWIAHRGAGKLAPENTLAAFRVGAGFGYRAFECDVKLSADGVPFLLHDSTLQRTTSAHGVAGALTWDELSRLDAGGWHSQAFVGEPLPSLDTIAGFCLGHAFALNIELKPTRGTESETGRVVAGRAASLWSDSATGRDSPLPPLLSSFERESLAGARLAAPSLPRALLLESLSGSWLDDALGLGCVAVVSAHEAMDEQALGRIRAAGLHALVYTVNEGEEARRLVRLGIDGIITDAVDRFSPGEGFDA